MDDLGTTGDAYIRTTRRCDEVAVLIAPRAEPTVGPVLPEADRA
jgi:hypothetical protein